MKNKFEKKELIMTGIFLLTSCIAGAFGGNYGAAHKKEIPVASEAETSTQIPEATTAAKEVEKSTAEQKVENKEPYVIVLDAGHGGNDSGCEFHSDEGTINEKTLNMKIAKYMKEYLEEYDDVKILMSRKKDEYISLSDRTNFAINNDADYFISLHNNSMTDAGGYAEGSSICVAMGNYNEQTGRKSQELGCVIIHELAKVGLKNNGLVMRSSMDTEYENGRAADYFANIRNTLVDDIAGIIIEHGFMDNPNDFYDYLCSEAQLRKVALADATGVARYLQLQKKDTGEVLKPLKNYKVKISHIGRNGTKRFSKVYFKTK